MKQPIARIDFLVRFYNTRQDKELLPLFYKFKNITKHNGMKQALAKAIQLYLDWHEKQGGVK